MAEINQESGVFGGISFENNMNQSGVVENAGTIRNEALPVKTGFWQKFKAFWLQDIDWNQEIRVELTPAQQKVEDEIIYSVTLGDEISFTENRQRRQ